MAEQYSWISANNEGYSAGKFSDVDGNIMPWSRSTVADGKWLNREMLLPFSGRDQYLLKSLNQTYDECSAFSGYLNEEIRIINARADVIDVVGSHDAFTARSAELVSGVDISDRDVIKILNDVGTDIPVWIYNTETNVYVESAVSPSNQQTYYRWLSAVNDGLSGWEYVGDLEPYYKDIELTENSITFENTAPERDYTIKTDLNRFIQMSADGNTGTIGITDDFISSASQVYNALSSISGINEGSISGPRVNHTVSNYSLAQGSANSASYDSFTQGKRNYAYDQSIAAGADNYAKSQSQALGISNSAYNNGFAAGSNNSATLAASFAQGSTNYADNSSFAQGTSNSALTQSFAQGKNNSANYDAFAQGLSAFANNESLAQGLEVTAKSKSFAQGSKNNADIYGFAQGTNCSAKTNAFAQGSNITATTTGFAQGDKCKANNIALAQGQYASANDYSMAQGQKVYANYVSFAEGEVASAKSVSFAQGNDAVADGYSFVQGHMASATNMSMAQGHNNVWAYQTSFAQGQQVSAENRGMAQGNNANANENSFAQGYNVTATTAAFAQGNTVKSNYYSISQGLNTFADNYSISQGTNTSAQYYSIAQGNATTADDYSQSFGRGTKMLHSGMAIGTYNKSDNIPFVIGNGTDNDNRSDLFLINRNGDVSAKGDISAKNFYINGNPIDSIVSAKFSAYNGSTTLLTAYPISSFSLYANTAKYLNVATASNNRLDFSVADTLINSAKSGAAASAWITGNSGNYIPWTAVNGAVGRDNQLPSSPGNDPWMLFGSENTGSTWNSYAFGTKNFAGGNSLAVGNTNNASDQSLALGAFCVADNDSIAVGTNNTAKNHSQAFGHGTHIEGRYVGTTPHYIGGLAIGNYNKTTADVSFVIGNGHDNFDRSDLFFITTAGLVSAITVDTPKLSAENVTVYYTSMGNKKASVTIDGIQGFNQYIHEGGQASDLWSSGALRQNNLTLAYHETNVDPMTEIVKINQSKVQYSSSNLTAPITASWSDILNGSLNAGNYVSAGDNQKLTMMSADNTTFTIAGMSPNIIYIV